MCACGSSDTSTSLPVVKDTILFWVVKMAQEECAKFAASVVRIIHALQENRVVDHSTIFIVCCVVELRLTLDGHLIFDPAHLPWAVVLESVVLIVDLAIKVVSHLAAVDTAVQSVLLAISPFIEGDLLSRYLKLWLILFDWSRWL